MDLIINTTNMAKKYPCQEFERRLKTIPAINIAIIINERCVGIENPASIAYKNAAKGAVTAANHEAGIFKNCAGSRRHVKLTAIKTTVVLCQHVILQSPLNAQFQYLEKSSIEKV